MSDTFNELQSLNGASTWLADVSSGASQVLTVSSIYTMQALSADTYVGFGAASAAAITDGNSSHGEKLVADAPPRIFVCTSVNVLYVGCSGGTLRIRKADTP